MASNEYVAALIVKALKGEISPVEQTALDQWAGQSESHLMTVHAFLEEAKLAKGIREHWVEDLIWARLDSQVRAEDMPGRRRIPFARYVAAASTLLLIGLGIYLWKTSSRPNQGSEQPLATQQDVAAPTKTRAVITLAGGRQVALDSLSKGLLASQGRVRIVKLADGGLAYNGKDREIFYNTLTNARGSQVVTLALADGTRVWLNAASSIRYPAAFTGGARQVEITGEAYFEVAENASKPFKVKANGKEEVEVLGTRFDINAFEDEPEIKTTLLEGAVRIAASTGVTSSEWQQKTLKPDQQAQFYIGDDTHNRDTRLTVASDVDMESVLAWKNGRFQFDGIGIHEVMRELARWYDVQVEYRGTIKDQHFRGGIPRSASVSGVLRMLESTGVLHFSIQDKKIIVMP